MARNIAREYWKQEVLYQADEVIGKTPSDKEVSKIVTNIINSEYLWGHINIFIINAINNKQTEENIKPEDLARKYWKSEIIFQADENGKDVSDEQIAAIAEKIIDDEDLWETINDYIDDEIINAVYGK